MKNIIFFLLCCLTGVTQAQQTIGDWEEYLSYSKVHSVIKSGDKVYAASSVGMYSYDIIEGIISKYSKVNSLSDVGISAIALIPETEKIFIGYENGNIDIFEDGKVDNIPDLKIKSLTTSKRINHIHFVDDKAFCSTDFGILVINYNKLEVSDFYYIGDNALAVKVNQIAHTEDSIYAATDEGLRSAPINSELLTFYETWNYVFDSKDLTKAVLSLGNELVVVKNENNSDFLYKYDLVEMKSISNLSGFVKLKNIDDDYISVEKSKVRIFSSDHIVKETFDSYDISEISIQPSFSCVEKLNDRYYFGDLGLGLVQKVFDEDVQILPDGPYTNRCYKLLVENGDVWSVSGPIHGFPLETYPAECNVLTSKGWIILNRSTQELFKGRSNICDVVVDPTNSQKAYLASARDGIFEVEINEEGDYEVVEFYNKDNSTIQAIFNWNHPWNVINGISIDPNGNLFANNMAAKYPIVIKPKIIEDNSVFNDFGWYKYRYMTYELNNQKDYEANLPWLRRMLYTSWDDVWSISASYPNGLFIFRHNGTIEDESDDLYRAPKDDFNDSRNSIFKIWDNEGNEIGEKAQCIAEDKDGYIWVGLSKGLVVYYRPRSVFDIDKPVASKISVPRNDGSGLADYLLDDKSVSAIAIDEANRKWIGTQNSGLYLISADGTQIISSFNENNSPLLSNTINSIDIEDKTGKVFIGTNKGIVSYYGTAISASETFSNIEVFPNPVKPDYYGVVIIKGLVLESNVKITDISGSLVFEGTSIGGQIIWDGRNFDREKVKTGVYLIYAASPDGEMDIVGKLMIIR